LTLPSALDTAVGALSSFSGAFRRYLAAEPDRDAALADAEALAAGAAVPAPAPPADVLASRAALSASLRRCRRRAFVTGALAEQLAGDPAVTFRWATACAEAWISAAFDFSARSAAIALGGDPVGAGRGCGFAVIGLGKLGAGELNPSSDVDLVVVHASDEPASWPFRVPPHAFHERVAREAAALLSEPTGDGFCLRVDFDLRPEGKSGALVNSLDALAGYCEQFGTPLDRMAWTRARPVAGDPDLGRETLLALAPFVWPRSLGSGALEALAGVLGRLRGLRARSRDSFDLKLDRGGIRDVELTVAAHQLLHGGRVPGLRDPATLSVIAALPRAGLMDPADAAALDQGYRALRRLEHLVQYREDRRTQALLLAPDALDAFAAMLAPPATGAALADDVASLRRSVAAVADRLFGLEGEGAEGDPVAVFVDPAAADDDRWSAGRRLGLADPDAAAAHLARMRSAPQSPARPGHRGWRPGFETAVLAAASRTGWPDGALDLLARLARSPRAAAVTELCAGDGRVLDSVARVGASSPVLAAALLRDPGAALEHAVTGFRGELPSAEDLDAGAARVLASPADEVGEALAAFRQRHLSGVMLADLAGADPADVGAGLSDIADACVRCALDAVGLGGGAPIAVLGLGRLGGRETGYLSDLDLVLVHRGDAAELTRGVQRALSLLTTRGAAGPMYELDFRLRPSGNQGPLLVEAGEFAAWHERGASAAERLGVLGCRVVAGDRAIGDDVTARAKAAAASALAGPGAVAELRAVRERQRAPVAEGGERAYHPKSAAGGMLDVETAAHLWGARQVPDPARMPPGTVALLGELARTGGRARQDLAALDPGYRFLLRLSNRAHLVLDRPVGRVAPDGPAADRLGRSLGFEGASPGEALWQAYCAALADGRKRCEALMALLQGES